MVNACPPASSAVYRPHAFLFQRSSGRTGLWYENMERAVAELYRRAYLETVRGQKGDAQLTRDSGEIHIDEVIRQTDKQAGFQREAGKLRQPHHRPISRLRNRVVSLTGLQWQPNGLDLRRGHRCA
jgi:Iron-dependent Transcriptional regulator